jgi:hypothetical protein
MGTNKNGKKSSDQINAEIREALKQGNKLSLMRSAGIAQGIVAHKEGEKIDSCPYRGAMAELADWWRCGWWVQYILMEKSK